MGQESGRQMDTHPTKEEEAATMTPKTRDRSPSQLSSHKSQQCKAQPNIKEIKKTNNSQERNPSQVFEHGRKHVGLAQSVFQERVPHISDSGEHNRASEENLKRV